MSILYDNFNEIIKFADISVQLNLYFVNSTIRKLLPMLNDTLVDALFTFCRNPYYNPNAKSALLNNFLNDLTGYDDYMLKDLQRTFGLILTKQHQIIQLTGSSNGKSTFMFLLRKVFGVLYIRMLLGSFNKNAYIIEIPDYRDQDKFKIKLSQSTIIIPTNKPLYGQIKTFQFKTEYTNFPQPHQKLRQNMEGLNNPEVFSSFLNFLLEGCNN